MMTEKPSVYAAEAERKAPGLQRKYLKGEEEYEKQGTNGTRNKRKETKALGARGGTLTFKTAEANVHV
jgi:hypothetical protein